MEKSAWSRSDVITVACSLHEDALPLVQLAAGICRRSRKTLAIVHVIEPWRGVPTAIIAASSPRVQEALAAGATLSRAVAERHLEALASAIGGDVPVVKIVGTGRLIETLCHEAKSVGSSLLVVGANYAHDDQATGRGVATALAVIASSPVPVLVVDPSAAGVVGEHPRLMIADDLGPQGGQALRYGVEMAISLGDAALVHVHVNGVELEALETALGAAVASSHSPANPELSAAAVFSGMIDNLAAAMCSRIGAEQRLLATFGCRYDAVVVTGDVTERLATLAAELEPNIVVFGRHQVLHSQPFFVGRVPLKAMMALRRAILTVPEV